MTVDGQRLSAPMPSVTARNTRTPSAPQPRRQLVEPPLADTMYGQPNESGSDFTVSALAGIA